MTFKWKVNGFDNYLVSKEGYIVRVQYKTSHLHYKHARFISHNSRNQFRLWRNGKQEIWSKRQLRHQLIPIKPIEMADSCKLMEMPF